jgi:DNA mismatch repair protein MutS2
VEATKGGVITRTHAEEVLELSKVLKSLSNFCNTEPAKKRAAHLCPMETQAAVESELEKVATIQRSGETAEFYVPFEPDFLQTQVKNGLFLSLEILVRMRRFLRFVTALNRNAKNSKLKVFFMKLHTYPGLLKELDSKIDEAGAMRDDASPDLLRIRTRKKQIRNHIRQLLNTMLTEQPNVYTGFNVVERAGHLVLPVKSNFKKQIKGIVHSYSNSGETVFIEPMAITEDAAGVIELDENERLEIESILRHLTDIIRDDLTSIEDDIEHVVSLDLWFAKTRFANDQKANRPVFAERLSIINGFHPILKRINDRVVPLNLKLDSGKRVLLISGPNAGGKTVVLKTVGLIVLMARCGLFIPADEGSTVPFFDELFADIGDEQSIESQLSTFAAHLKQIRKALDGNSNSLVLLDELMSQTSVEEGSALASAILDEFSRRDSIVLATTHNENLKIYVSNRQDMINAGMEFTDRPTYRLILGVPQPSNALRLASQLGLQKTVLEKAVLYLDEEKVSVNRLFEDLSGQLKAVEEEREKLSSLVDDYENKLAAFNVKKKQESDELRSKYRNELTKAKRDVEKLIKALRKEGPKPDMVGKTRHFFKDKLDFKGPAEPYHPDVGELVRIRELRRIGQVVAEKQGKYKIGLQNIFYWVEPTDIESIKEEKGVMS